MKANVSNVSQGWLALRKYGLLAAWAAVSLACATLSCAPPSPTLPAPLQWRKTLPQGIQLVSPPALAEGLLVYQEDAKDVVARDAASGAEKWRHVLSQSSNLQRPLAVIGGLVFVDEDYADSAGATHSRVMGLDLHTGQTTWENSIVLAPKQVSFGPPVAGDSLIYFGGGAAPGQWQLSAAEPATGQVKWQSPLTGTALAGDPLFADGLVIVAIDNPTASQAPYADDLLAVDAATGARRWQVPLDARAAPFLAAGDGRVYAVADDGWFWALDEQSGGVVWKNHFRNGSQVNFSTSPASLAGNALYFGDSEDNLFALDAATGQQLWRAGLGALNPQRPAVSGGRLYLGLTNGLLVALDAASGSALWTTPNPLRKSWPDSYTPPLETAPVVVDGVLYYFNGTELVALRVP